MAVINLADKYEKKLDERYQHRSFTDKWCGSAYNWEGVNSIKVWTINAGELHDYTASGANRFGTPAEVEDELNVYTLLKKRSFTNTIDITNTQDQMFIKRANSFLKQMWDERYVPEIDKYRLKVWANGAGLGKVNSTALTKATVVEAVLTALADMDDAAVPSENRVILMASDVAIQTRLASELANNQNWTDKAIVKGKIAELGGVPVVAIPSSYLPSGVEFMVKYKNATADPQKLKMLRSNDNAPGIAGVLMEGLVRYDSFVLAQKADGIYVYSKSGVCATPTASITSNAVTLTCSTSSATIKYTTDGTNPKTSSTAQTYSAAVTITKDTHFRFYAEASGMVNSAIASYDAVKS